MLLAWHGDGGVQGLVRVLLRGAQVAAGWGGDSGEGISPSQCHHDPWGLPSSTRVGDLPWCHFSEDPPRCLRPPQGSPLGTKDGNGGPLQCHCLPWGPPSWTLGVGESPQGSPAVPGMPPWTPGTGTGIPLSATAHPGDTLQVPGVEMGGPLRCPLGCLLSATTFPGTPVGHQGWRWRSLPGTTVHPGDPPSVTRDGGAPPGCHHPS